MVRRPTGVVVVAVVLGLGTLFLLLFALGSGVMAIAMPHMAMPSNGTPPPPPGLMLATMLFTTLLYLAMAGWSGATLVGLVRMRSWARVSAMILGGVVAFFSLMGAFGVLAASTMLPSMQLPPGTNPAAMRMVFGFMIFCSLGMVAVGVWWLVYFALRNTREAFRHAQAVRAQQTLPSNYPYPPPPAGPVTDFTVAQPVLSEAADGMTNSPVVAEPVAGAWPQANPNHPYPEQYIAEPVISRSRRPVSMTVVAVLLLIGSFFALLQMTSSTPMFFMSVVLSGWPAHITVLMICAVSGVAGLGVLKLQKPAWVLAFGLFCMYVLNGLSMLLPGGRVRFAGLMQEVMSRSPMGPTPFPFGGEMLSLFAILSAAFAVAFGGTMLFLLWRSRLAFEPAANNQAAP